MNSPRRIALLLAYHGGAFHGFQRQPGFPTVQEELEEAWLALSGETVVIHGSGRTDSGVHAWGQVVHLNTWSTLPVAKLRPALNAYLPPEIVVREAVEVPPEFHARVSACGKRYLYRIVVSPVRPVLSAGLAAWERTPLDLEAMRGGARFLLGRHDFAAYAAAGGQARGTVRRLRSLKLRPVRGGLVLLVEGDGFLYRMVRNLAGSLLEVGRRRRAPEWMAAVLESRDRRRAGPTAPPEGLYLWRVLYPHSPFSSFLRSRRRSILGGPEPCPGASDPPSARPWSPPTPTDEHRNHG